MKKIVFYVFLFCIGCSSTSSKISVENSLNETTESFDSFADVAAELEEFNEKVEEETDCIADLPQSEIVDIYYEYFTQKERPTFVRWLERAKLYLPEIIEIFREKGLPEELVFLPFAESGFNPWAYSRAGAGGMWQFMPGTARGYGLQVNWWIDERRDPRKSTLAAAKYLQYLYDQFKDWQLALAAYNAGPGTVRRAIAKSGGERDFFSLARSKKKYFVEETKHYVPKFIAILKIIRNLEELGFEPLNLEDGAQLQMTSVPLNGAVNLRELAFACGISWKEFTRLNPEFRRSVSAPTYKGFVRVPTAKAMVAQKKIKTLRVAKNQGIQRYKVRRGESLWTIARIHNATVQDLKYLNGLKSNIIRPGQWLLVAMDENSPTVSAKRTSRKNKQLIPRSRSNYRVKNGDTLWGIARKFGTSTQTLLVANGLNKKSVLRAGDKLYIPDGVTAKERDEFVPISKSYQFIQKGDFQDVANRLQTSLYNIVDNKNMGEGQILSSQRINYSVRQGDTLWDIARRFQVSVGSLLSWNGMKENEVLRAGKNLIVYLP